MSLKCKYCEKSLENSVYYARTDNDEVNCESCEIVCRIAVDMISSGVHSIGKHQPERSKREDLENVECKECERTKDDILRSVCCSNCLYHYLDFSKMRCSEHCGNTVREVQ